MCRLVELKTQTQYQIEDNNTIVTQRVHISSFLVFISYDSSVETV